MTVDWLIGFMEGALIIGRVAHEDRCCAASGERGMRCVHYGRRVGGKTQTWANYSGEEDEKRR